MARFGNCWLTAPSLDFGITFTLPPSLASACFWLYFQSVSSWQTLNWPIVPNHSLDPGMPCIFVSLCLCSGCSLWPECSSCPFSKAKFYLFFRIHFKCCLSSETVWDLLDLCQGISISAFMYFTHNTSSACHAVSHGFCEGPPPCPGPGSQQLLISIGYVAPHALPGAQQASISCLLS